MLAALVSFAAPLWLALLVLPAAVLLLGARGAVARALFTGTFALWSTLDRRDPARERRRRRLPPALWLLALALVAGVLALARPLRVEAAAPRVWSVVVDRSPAMYLVEGGRTRLARALEPVETWIASAVRAEDTLEWIDALHAEPRASRGAPRDLLEAPLGPLASPDWARFDRPGALWVAARVESLPREAGLSASGGAAIPGPIGREGRTRLDWNGRAIVRVDEAYAPGELALALDPRLPATLRALAELWAAQHALASHPSAPGGALLELVLEPAGAPRERALGRDGWSATATLGDALVPQPGEERWLEVEGAAVLVRPGRVRTNLRALGEIAGDPAAFAVSWGELFDRAQLDPPGCAPLAARAAQGEPVWRAPNPAGTNATSQEQELEWICALAAALLALLAWAWRGPVAE